MNNKTIKIKNRELTKVVLKNLKSSSNKSFDFTNIDNTETNYTNGLSTFNNVLNNFCNDVV